MGNPSQSAICSTITFFVSAMSDTPFRKGGNEGKDEDTFAEIPILVKGLVLLDNLIVGR